LRINLFITDALCYYERALALNDELIPVLHLNMAAALLELKRYTEASEHAKKALDGGANKGKALYR
jgi:tetratricopeptide (TPR) repeat protein